MKTKKVTVGSVIKWILVVLLLVIQVYPFVYVMISSFKSLDDFRKLPAYALPSSFYIGNYVTVFTKSHMLTYFKNSVIVLIGVLIPLLLIALMAGFALSKIKFRGKKFLLNYFLLGLMLPMQVALIPLFTIFNKLGLINTYAAIILPQISRMDMVLEAFLINGWIDIAKTKSSSSLDPLFVKRSAINELSSKKSHSSSFLYRSFISNSYISFVYYTSKLSYRCTI